MYYLVEKFQKDYGDSFPNVHLNISTFFDTKEILSEKIKKMIGHHNEINTLKDLNIPHVDTVLIYSSFIPTKTAYIYDEKKNAKSFQKIDVLAKGGDGTVPTWSSLLVGLKWLYDKKMNNLTQTIQLVEYCSMMSKQGSSYVYNKSLPYEQEFVAIGCDCLDEDNLYDINLTTKKNACEHGRLPGDSKIIQLIENYIQDEKNTNYTTPIENDKLTSLNNYSNSMDYKVQCNTNLFDLAQSDNID